MTTRQVRHQIRTSGLNPSIISHKLQDHTTAGKCMASSNKRNRRYYTGHTYVVNYSCGHTYIVHCEVSDAGSQDENQPCTHCQTFGVFN